MDKKARPWLVSVVVLVSCLEARWDEATAVMSWEAVKKGDWDQTFFLQGWIPGPHLDGSGARLFTYKRMNTGLFSYIC